MNSVDPAAPYNADLGFLAYRGLVGPRLVGSANGEEDRRPRQEPPQQTKNFSDADLDILLRKAGVEITPRHRQLARFFLIHHLVLSPELFRLVDRLFPAGLPRGLQAEALIAAISRLPLAEAEGGFRIIKDALDQGHPTVMGQVRLLKAALDDMVSQSFFLEEAPIDAELLRAAVSEEIAQWDELLADPGAQLRLIVDRGELLRRLAAWLRMANNLSMVLEEAPGEIAGRLRNLLLDSHAAARRAVMPLLADAILSREDVHHHLREQGACHSPALFIGGEAMPLRVWAHNRDNPASADLERRNLVVLFRWFTRELGILEAEADFDEEALSVTFASEDPTVLLLLEELRLGLEERLSALGFKARQRPSSRTLRLAERDAEIGTAAVPLITHLDTQA